MTNKIENKMTQIQFLSKYIIVKYLCHFRFNKKGNLIIDKESLSEMHGFWCSHPSHKKKDDGSGSDTFKNQYDEIDILDHMKNYHQDEINWDSKNIYDER